MSIFLIRHAESEANINGRTLSHAAIVLSERGHQQAKKLCNILPVIDHVIISKYLRTQQTAQPTIDKYQINYEIDTDIHEFSYLSEQKCQNTTMAERKIWVDAYWGKMDDDYRDAEDAESFADLYTRVQNFYQKLNRLKADYVQKNLVVFSHGQFLQLLKMMMHNPQPLSKELMTDFRLNLLHQPIPNAEIFMLK